MTALHESLRKHLEKTVVQARDVAEEGAQAALQRLGIGAPKAFHGLATAERELRNQLRARGRQIGDVRKTSGEQTTDRLAGELAYEYWHRMLFARFLAENDLLMHPDGVSVSLADCEDLAKEEGLANGWLLAERYAARMLPEIFRPGDPLLQVPFAPEHERSLERLLEALQPETFRASDSLGWVYQFWQSKRKKEVNDSGEQIGADELPAVTQLFTEPYMVHFLLDNTLGAWWTARHPTGKSPVAFDYLRKREDGTPAAGSFDEWPKRVAEVKVLDPCCGSGHFLVAAFRKLVPMRMQEEGLSARDACDAVLRDNLNGLEIDPRCTQIAAFAVALVAWTFEGAGGFRTLPQINIACSGTRVRAKREEWLDLAGGESRLEAAIDQLWKLFQQAPELGSLLNPQIGVKQDLLTASLEDIQPLVASAILMERSKQEPERQEIAVSALGAAEAATLLSTRFTLVVTNVPYLGRGKQPEALRDFAKLYYPRSLQDLGVMLIERSVQLCSAGGTVGVVSPESWLFQSSYREFRANLLNHTVWNCVALLGVKSFRTPMWDLNIMLVVLTASDPSVGQALVSIDASDAHSIDAKATELRESALATFSQRAQLSNPESIVVLKHRANLPLLGEFAIAPQGLKSGDDDRYRQFFWEHATKSKDWEFFQSTPSGMQLYGGRESIVRWEGGTGDLAGSKSARVQGRSAWGRRGIAVSQMGALPATLYTGEIFDSNVAPIVPHKEEHVLPIWAYCSSAEFCEAVRQIDKKAGVANGTLLRVPFDLDYWNERAGTSLNNALVTPLSPDPTQWVFSGSISESDAPLHVVVPRLLGYRWPQQVDSVTEISEDADGIVCLPAAGGERPASDRLVDLMIAAYGTKWTSEYQSRLFAADASSGATLESWLRDDFFSEHCALFHQRPFIWHVWDGRKDGFAALVNYHRLDRHNLQTLAYTYLGDWIARQESDAKSGVKGADLRLAAARELQRKLELILEGEPPHDIFVRWKTVERQSIGWKPDMNDGVRINVRPFVRAGVLRRSPKLDWKKDRGSNPPGSPWYELGHGERFNSYEEYSGGDPLTNAMKLAAREKSRARR